MCFKNYIVNKIKTGAREYKKKIAWISRLWPELPVARKNIKGHSKNISGKQRKSPRKKIVILRHYIYI